VPVSELCLIDKARWHANSGGLLHGGSRLGDALYEGARMLCNKPKGRSSLVLLADGWPRFDETPYQEVSYQLEKARSHGVKVLFLAFLSEASKHQLQPFVNAVGLKDEEVYIFSSTSAQQQAKDARRSTKLATEFVINTSIMG
jgi:hypothetical protein